MAWRFDSISNGLIWTVSIELVAIADGSTDLGGGDLLIDTGLRENDSSVVDQGQRIIDGSI
jgi:hypothetical protein